MAIVVLIMARFTIINSLCIAISNCIGRLLQVVERREDGIRKQRAYLGGICVDLFLAEPIDHSQLLRKKRERPILIQRMDVIMDAVDITTLGDHAAEQLISGRFQLIIKVIGDFLGGAGEVLEQLDISLDILLCAERILCDQLQQFGEGIAIAVRQQEVAVVRLALDLQSQIIFDRIIGEPVLLAQTVSVNGMELNGKIRERTLPFLPVGLGVMAECPANIRYIDRAAAIVRHMLEVYDRVLRDIEPVKRFVECKERIGCRLIEHTVDFGLHNGPRPIEHPLGKRCAVPGAQIEISLCIRGGIE